MTPLTFSNLRKLCLSIFFLGLLANISQAQTERIRHYPGDLNCYAPNGLRLRSEPNFKGKVLTVIPFGKMAHVDSKKVYNELDVDGIKGYWQGVSYNGQNGYAFTGYLHSHPIWNPEHAQSEVVLSIPGNEDALNFRPQLTWYGFFENEGVLSLKKVKVAVDMSDRPALVAVDEPNCLLLLGTLSKNQLVEGKLTDGIQSYLEGYSKGWDKASYRNQKSVQGKGMVLKSEAGIEHVSNHEATKSDLICEVQTKRGVVSQNLSEQLKDIPHFSSQLTLLTDLNGDFVSDVLMDVFYDDGKAIRILFMSTDYKQTLLKRVGMMHVPMGC